MRFLIGFKISYSAFVEKPCTSMKLSFVGETYMPMKLCFIRKNFFRHGYGNVLTEAKMYVDITSGDVFFVDKNENFCSDIQTIRFFFKKDLGSWRKSYPRQTQRMYITFSNHIFSLSQIFSIPLLSFKSFAQFLCFHNYLNCQMDF